MKRTFQGKNNQATKDHGFRKKITTAGGRATLARRRAKGRKRLTTVN